MADDDVWNIETCSENWKALCVFKANNTIRLQSTFHRQWKLVHTLAYIYYLSGFK